MHEPLREASMPSSPTNEKKSPYNRAKTKGPETERIRKLRDRSNSPTASPTNSSRRSRSIAVEKTIQNAKDKVHQKRISRNNHNNNSGDAMVLSSSNHTNQTNTSAMSASAILDRRRPLQLQDAAEGTMARRRGSVSSRNSGADQSAIASILGIVSSSANPTPKVRNGANTKVKRNHQRSQTLPSIPSFNGGQHDDIDSSSSGEEEVDLNDRPPRPRKTSRSRTSSKDDAIYRNTQILSPNRGVQSRLRDQRVSNGDESVSSLSGSEGGCDRRSQQQQIKDQASPTFNKSERTDGAIRPPKEPTRSSPHAVQHSSINNDKNADLKNNSHIPPAPYPHDEFQSPTATRGTVSPLSSPSNHDVPENISPLTTSTKTFLTGPIRMYIPWAKGSDMGGAKKEQRKLLNDEGDAEAEDSFEMHLGEASMEFRQLMEADKNPIRPDRLSSIRSLSWKERHQRNSYPHELEMYKARFRNDPDYMPNQPTRFRGSSVATNSVGRASMFDQHSSSMGSFSLAGGSSMGTGIMEEESMVFGESVAHELGVYKAGTKSPAALDSTPMKPTRLSSMHSMKFQQSSGSFSIGTYDTMNDGELRPASGINLQKESSVNDDKVEKEPVDDAIVEKKPVNGNQKKSESQSESDDEIESLETEEEEVSIRSLSPSPKEKTKPISPMRAPHTVGATAKHKITLFLSPLSKLSMPKSPGSMSGRRSFGRKKGDAKDNTGNIDKMKSWLPALGSKNGSKDEKAETEGSKRSKRSTRTSKQEKAEIEEGSKRSKRATRTSKHEKAEKEGSKRSKRATRTSKLEKSEKEGSKRSIRANRAESAEAVGSKRSTREPRRSSVQAEEVSKEPLPTDQSPGSLSGIKKALQNRQSRSVSPFGASARVASKKTAGRTKKRNSQQTDDS